MASASPGQPPVYQGAPASATQQHGEASNFFLSNYRLGKTAGIGSFGKVKVAEHVLTGHKVAIKILNRRKIRQMDMDEKVRREIKILRLFMHPHIIRLYEVVETNSDIYVIMEYVRSGELFDYIVEKGRLVEDEARHFFQQIVSGVEYCHRNMVVHRDLKPENLLLDARMNVKIADFGLSNVMRDGHFLKTSCGSPNYAAPEVISGRLYAGPEVDVWSCGVILYALLCGSLPFDDENIPNLFKKIKGGIYTLPSHLSPAARDLIPRMLLVDPLKRITIPEIRAHPWFALHLPRYLAVPHADPLGQLGAPDLEVVEEVVRGGFDRGGLLTALRRRETTEATVTYHLLADNRRRMPSASYLREHMADAAAPLAGLGSAQRLVVERRWRLGWGSRLHPSTIVQDLCRSLAAAGIAWKRAGPYNYRCRAAVAVCRPAAEVMEEAGAEREGAGVEDMDDDRDLDDDRAIEAGGGGLEGVGEEQEGDAKELDGGGGGDAKTLSRSGRSGESLGGSSMDEHEGEGEGGAATLERLVKFEVQVYKVREGEYVLDFQRVSGDLFLYMDLCGKVLYSLRV